MADIVIIFFISDAVLFLSAKLSDFSEITEHHIFYKVVIWNIKKHPPEVFSKKRCS